MIRECQMTENGMRCDEDGELCIPVSNKATWVCWEHFQDMEAPNLKIIRQKIAQDIEKLLEHREDFCDEYDGAIMRAAECVRFPDE